MVISTQLSSDRDGCRSQSWVCVRKSPALLPGQPGVSSHRTQPFCSGKPAGRTSNVNTQRSQSLLSGSQRELSCCAWQSNRIFLLFSPVVKEDRKWGSLELRGKLEVVQKEAGCRYTDSEQKWAKLLLPKYSRPSCTLDTHQLHRVCSSVSAGTVHTGRCYMKSRLYACEKAGLCDFPSCSVAESMLPMQGAWVWALVRELDPTCCKLEFTCHN